MSISILQSGSISGIGTVTFNLESAPPDNSLIVVIVTGGFALAAPAAPFTDLAQISGDGSYADATYAGIALGRYASSMGTSITTYSAGTQGNTHWIGFYYVIAVGGSSASDALDATAMGGETQHTGSSPYFPYNYNSQMIPYSGSHGVYTFPTVTPSESDALIIIPWQTPSINDPAPEATGYIDALNTALSDAFTMDCSTTFVNPDEQTIAANASTDGSIAGPNAYVDCLYVGHALVNATPTAYTPQIQFSGDGPLNNVIQTYYVLGYSLQYAGAIVIMDPGGSGSSGSSSSSGSGSSPTPVTYTMEITPNPATVPIGQTQKFVATKVGSDGSRSNPPVLWTTNCGTIDDEGNFEPISTAIGSGQYTSSGSFTSFEVTATENDAVGV